MSPHGSPRRRPPDQQQQTVLRELAAIVRRARRLEADADRLVIEARERGCSWPEIGEALGVTHPTAMRRYRAAVDRLAVQAMLDRFDPKRRSSAL